MKHSAFVGFPIDLRMEHRKEEEEEVEEDGQAEKRRKAMRQVPSVAVRLL